MEIEGKHALITGGSRGIGFAIACELAKEGCEIHIIARAINGLRTAKKTIEGYGVKCHYIQCDVMNKQNIDDTLKNIGPIDILVNNVGGGGRWGSENVEKTSEQVWVEVYNKNVLSAIRFTTGLLPYMRRQKWGRIVTITSSYGKEAGGRPWFNVAKCAQTTLMKNLSIRRDLVRDGITFNSVAPGPIMIPNTGWETEMLRDEDRFATMVDKDFVLGRLGTPVEVANIVVFLCSKKSSLINGSSVSADGGQSHYF